MRFVFPSWLRFTGAVLLYLAGTRLAQNVQEGFDNVTLIWLPAGVALAALLVLGLRYWPAVAVADLIAQGLVTTNPPGFLPFSAAANTIAAVAGAHVAQRLGDFDSGGGFTVRAGFVVLVASAVVAVVSAPIGVAGLIANDMLPAAAMLSAFNKWVAADLFGAVLIAPALLLASQARRTDRRGIDLYDGGREERLLWVIVAGVGLGFSLWLRETVPQYPLGFVGFPLAMLVWSALRFPPLFTAIASLLTGVGLVLAVGLGRIGFPPPSTHGDSIVLLLYLSTVALAPLFLAAASLERRLAHAALIAANEQLERRVEARTVELSDTNQKLSDALDELKEAQQSLVQQETMASLSGLVAGVAHELNTPVGIAMTSATHLSAINEELQTAIGGGTLSKRQLEDYLGQQGEGLRIAVKSLKRASELVATFKQVAVDQSSQQRRRIDLADFLGEIRDALEAAHKRRLQILVECPPGLSIETYPGTLLAVLTQLIGNAATHGYPGDATGKVRIEVGVLPKEQLRLWVRDEGAGMTVDVAAHAFEPFVTTRRGQGSTGLGLHIVFNLVTQALGGTIALRSAPGEGSEFRIDLPRTAPVRAASGGAHG